MLFLDGYRIFLAKSPKDDPRIKYRQKVKRRINRSNCIIPAERILNSLPFQLNVAPIGEQIIDEPKPTVEKLDEFIEQNQVRDDEILGQQFITKSLANQFEFDIVKVDAQGKIVTSSRGCAELFAEKLGNGVVIEMVSIPSGKFFMGSSEDELERSEDESPQHPVTMQNFCISKYPVTQAQWKAVAELPQVNINLEANPSSWKGDRRPVEQVSWYDAVEFCSRLTAYTTRLYRLPSEAEWEYVCRAGTTTPFHFGETITSELVNYNANYIYARRVEGTYKEETTTVGSFNAANTFGLYDMHGNVWEWCLDDWHHNYEGAPNDSSPWFDKNNDHLSQKLGAVVMRGGSWYNIPNNCRSAYRLFSTDRNNHTDKIGFRIVCEVGRLI
ncbi:formylglycine-generating enzyme family protein [Nostoc sp. C052]|uniref:formylglycine-generating enzyme family protein n=1 Tax=Nostoc sp. C052 TaxID=2576902 RepID=UPI001C4C729B|nr:formylglycine-generating enzyme family protein [Nostoc sp. C052]